MDTEKQEIPFREKYAYETREEFEKLVGYKVNEVFKDGWSMARMKNKHFGFKEEPNEK